MTSGMPHHSRSDLTGAVCDFLGAKKPTGVCFKRPMNVSFDVRHVYILKN